MRRVDAQYEAARGTGKRRSWLALSIAAILLLTIGAVIGARGSSETVTTETLTVTVSTTEDSLGTVPSEATRRVGGAAGNARTSQGAAAAATAYVGALDGSALLDWSRLRTTLAAIASVESRAALVRAYEEAATQTRERLGLGTAPEPILILRAVPVGYRIDRFTRDAATVSLWRVGIIGSGATVEPQQSWRTETVSLVWERGGWKVASFRSSAGPTPPLAPSAATPASELFATVPEFEELKHARP